MDEVKIRELLKKDGDLTLNEVLIIIKYHLNDQFRYLEQINFKEFSNLFKPCYYPSIRYSIDNLLDTIYRDRDGKILKAIANIIKIDKRFKLFSNRYTLFLLFSILLTRLDNNKRYALTFFQTLTLQFYASLFYKYIRYCNVQKFEEAFRMLSRNHAFKKYNGISDFLKKLSIVILSKYYNRLSLKNNKIIIRFIFELRHRINQSLKSLANNYYEIEVISDNNEYDVELTMAEQKDIINNIQIIINKILQDFQVVKTLDIDLLKRINSIYHVKLYYVIEVMKELQNIDYQDELRTILLKLLNVNNALKLKDTEEWKKEIVKILKSRNKASDKSPRLLLRKLLLRTHTYNGFFANRNEVTKLRLENIIITYFMLKMSEMRSFH